MQKRRSATRKPAGAMPRWRFALYSVLPTMLLLAIVEIALRLAGLDTPSVRNVGLPEEKLGLMRLDPELFWALKPNLAVVADGARVETSEPPSPEGEGFGRRLKPTKGLAVSQAYSSIRKSRSSWGAAPCVSMYCFITASVTLPVVQAKYPRAHRCRPQNSLCSARNSLTKW